MNILLTSVGRRVKLVQYFVQENEGKGQIIAVDCDRTAPALYVAHQREQVPRIDDPAYIDTLLDICDRYQVGAVLSLIDPELTVLAENEQRFRSQGVKVVVSSPSVIEMCLDKKATADFLSDHGLPYIPTFTDKEEVLAELASGQITFPLLVKPRKGSASLGIIRVENEAEWTQIMEKGADVVVQPYLTAEEFGLDAYVDLITGKITNLFARKKLRMRAGETDRSLSVIDQRLTGIARKLLNVLKAQGPIDIDCFLVEDQFVISEINPRFGGGYPHAHESGENIVHSLFLNLNGLPSQPLMRSYREGTVMIKYDEVMLLNTQSQRIETLN